MRMHACVTEHYSIALVGLIKDSDPRDPKIMLIQMCGIFWPDSGIAWKHVPGIQHFGIDTPKDPVSFVTSR